MSTWEVSPCFADPSSPHACLQPPSAARPRRPRPRRDLRRRLLLVHRGGFRQGAGRDQHHVGLSQRQDQESDLQGSLGRRQRPRRGGRDRLRPREGDFRQAARRVLAQHRSAGEGPAVLRHRRHVPHRRLLSRRRAEEARGRDARRQVAAKFAPRTVYTEIVKADTFYKAEDYHQDYYKKNEARYNFYRWNCGRDQRLEQLWGKKESS